MAILSLWRSNLYTCLGLSRCSVLVLQRFPLQSTLCLLLNGSIRIGSHSNFGKSGRFISSTSNDEATLGLRSATTQKLPPMTNIKFEKPTSCHLTFSKLWGNARDVEKQIFCNRSLNMKSIAAIGFDMDYTLAQYKPDTFESLAYQGTIRKLVHDLGYPTELLQWTFDWKYMVRGLVVDKRRGNILKMDRHKYVKVAYHGFCELSREERMSTYRSTLSQESYDEPEYALIDTLFSLAEAYIFAQLVNLKDSFPERLHFVSGYEQMYKDVRAAIDLCHRDGTVKQAVADDPSKYIIEDQHIFPMLQLLRDSGRMTFLVTNSLWDYTNIVMNALHGKFGARGRHRDYNWLKYFDLVITGSAKPGFFVDGNRAPLFEVDIRSGMMCNTDNGRALSQVGDSGSDEYLHAFPHQQACRVFQVWTKKALVSLQFLEIAAPHRLAFSINKLRILYSLSRSMCLFTTPIV